MFWIPLAMAGASLAGSIGGSLLGNSAAKKAQKKQNKLAKKQLKYQQYLDANRVQITVADAKKAGIHPLAALGASGIGGWASPVQGPSYQPDNTWGDVAGAAGNAISNAFAGLYDQYQLGEDRKIAAASRELDNKRYRDEMYFRHGETSRADAQLLMMQKAQRLNERLMEAQIAETTSRTRLNQMRAAVTGGPMNTPGARAFVDPGGFTWDMDNTTTDAQDWSDRYGDIAGEFFGAGNLIRDLFYDDPATQ